MRSKKSSEDLLLLELEFRAEPNRQMGRAGEALPNSPSQGCTSPADSKVPLDMLQEAYVLRLMEEGVPAEKALDLIIEGMLRPN